MIVKVYENGFGEIYNSTWFGETITVQDEQDVTKFFFLIYFVFSIHKHPAWVIGFSYQVTDPKPFFK